MWTQSTNEKIVRWDGNNHARVRAPHMRDTEGEDTGALRGKAQKMDFWQLLSGRQLGGSR